jgi:Na+-exporting ATPase
VTAVDAMSPKDESVAQHVSGQSNKPMSNVAHALNRDVVTQELSSDARVGLTTAEAAKRLEEYGRNELDEGAGVQPFKILLRQIANAMMLVECSVDRNWYYTAC